MSDLIKIYPMTSDDSSKPSIFEALKEVSNTLYVEVPGLGFVKVSEAHAIDAVMRSGCDRFMLGKINSKNGLGDEARYIANYY